MKIAVIGQKRIPSREGGLEKTVEEQTARLAERGFHLVLYNRGGHNVFGRSFDTARRKQYRGMKIVTVPTLPGPWEVPIYSLLATLHALLTGCGFFYYHASGPCVMLPLARLFKRKCVAMLHGIDSRRDKWKGFAAWYLRQGEAAAVRRSDACLVLSSHMQEELYRRYGKKPLLIHNGVTGAAPSASEGMKAQKTLQAFGLRPGGYVLTVVRIVPEKGLHYLIPAFRGIQTDRKLVIVGGTEAKCASYLEQLKKLSGGDSRILFTGFLRGEEVELLYRNASAFVLPSTLEGMANALLEAMSWKLPCLVSDIPENLEVTGDTALSFRSRDQKDLRAKLKRLLSDPELSKSLGEAAEKRVMSRFSWDVCADRLEQVFRGLGCAAEGSGDGYLVGSGENV